LLLPYISRFGVHTYGMGCENYSGWWNTVTDYGEMVERVKNSPFHNCPLWMTEYGDLDLSGMAEFDFSWTITKRLMKTLKEGYSAALFWDAYDNFHHHDTAWTTFGLLKTDTLTWEYSPKTRYYASRQVFRFVRPGFTRVSIGRVLRSQRYDVYEGFHDTLKHIQVLAFVSPDNKDFTIVGMSSIESDFPLTITLKGLAPEAYVKKVHYFMTSRNDRCNQTSAIKINHHALQVVVKEKSIFTLSTLM